MMLARTCQFCDIFWKNGKNPKIRKIQKSIAAKVAVQFLLLFTGVTPHPRSLKRGLSRSRRCSQYGAVTPKKVVSADQKTDHFQGT